MEKKQFTRACPLCGCEITYTNVKNRNQSEKHKLKCHACVSKVAKLKNENKLNAMLIFSEEKNAEIRKIFDESKNWKEFRNKSAKLRVKYKVEARLADPKNWMRDCPKCGKTIHYSSIFTKQQGDRNNSNCPECAWHGENNPFFGKTHTEETKKKIGDRTSPAWQARLEYMRSEEYSAWASKEYSGSGNPRFGLGSLKDIWIRKHGEEEGIRKWDEWRAKVSAGITGEKNPMYGKPSPQGSGNGWSGWYKGWFFRSIHELSFMINVIERFKFTWQTGESRQYVVEYFDHKGQKRSYFPDFILNGKYVVECKPRGLILSPKVAAKTDAAKILFKERGLIFKIMTPPILISEEIMSLYLTKTIQFTERYEEKFINTFMS
jgi:predicted RNA-binding Zn-ribbon protein involved in translation (DUF1610 family)